MSGAVIALCVSERKGTQKHAVEGAELVVERGVRGDAHATGGHRQVSLLADEDIDRMRALGLELPPGAFGENVVTRGLDLPALKPGQRLRLGPEVLLEVTQIGKTCHSRCAIYEQTGDCIMPTRGVFARVVRGGRVRPGARIGLVDPMDRSIRTI